MRSAHLVVQLFVTLAVVTIGAATADAQSNFGELQMRLLRTDGDPFNVEEQREFFNSVSCACHVKFRVEMRLVGNVPPGDLGTAPVQIWVGPNCNEFSTERDNRCTKIDDSKIIQDFHLKTVTMDIDSAQLMNPKGSCAGQQSVANTVWALVDETNDGTSYEHTWQVTPTIAFDAKAPPAPTDVAAEGVEDAVKVTWKLPTSGVSELDRFQILCASATDGTPIFAMPAADPEYVRTGDIEGCSATIPTADAGVPADAATGDAATKPQGMAEFEALDPQYICSGRLSGSAKEFRIDLSDTENVQQLDPDEKILVKVVAMDNALNTTVIDVQSGGPQPVRDGWETYSDAGGEADGGFCFVATAVYGDYDHPYVRVLRALRDGTLAKFGLGRAFIDWYYAHSPPAAEYLRHHDVARALAAVALFPIVALAWAWNLLGVGGVLALAVLFWAWRRHRRAALVALAAVAVLLLAVAPASAQPVLDDSVLDEPAGPPISRWAFEIKLGPYAPDVDGESGLVGTPFKDTYGSGNSLFFGIELDRFFFFPYGQLGLAASLGFMTRSAKAWKQDPMTPKRTDVRSADDTAFRMFPTALSVVYRMTELADRTVVPLVPYGKVGLSYYIWQFTKGDGGVSETEKNGTARGGTLGWQATVGLSLRADRLDPEASRNLTTELGVEHAGFFFELTYASVSGLFQDNKLHVGDLTWAAGVNFEF